jgi:leucyl-tRNA synthetase
MWLNPDSLYVEATVDGESWIVSVEAANKFQFLGHEVEIVSEFLGNKLIGGTLTNPMTGHEVLILPASFVDPKNATGVVMSVPAHAPFDHVALKQLKKSSKKFFERYNLKESEVAKLKPVSLIELPGWGESPAVDIVEKMGITDQNDPRLEKATREIYSQEFHNGRLRRNTGQYTGLPVERAKDAVGNDMIADSRATTMYELIEPVKCRCGSDVLVKIFENQWFIDYGDQMWKELVHENLDSMEIIPRELRQEYVHVVDWLIRKACARNVGLGTLLPWAPDWIIESLSDSTIYMAYYTVIKDIVRLSLDAEKLNEGFWDYLFLNIGDAAEVAEAVETTVEELESIRTQFKYFYPLDARHSGRDLIPNHLTFMIFNHDAIFPRENWPRGIIVNGSVLMNGQKMSKSLNNIIPLRTAIDRFGTDPLRLALMITAEPLKDADFSPELAKSMADNLERFHNRVMKLDSGSNEDNLDLTKIDFWMLSRLQHYISEANEAMDEMKVRKTIHAALYNLNQDLDWYMKRVENQMDQSERKKAIHSVLRTIIDTQVRLLVPFTPHLCEEIWESMGNDGFAALAKWPQPDHKSVRLDAEELEQVIRDSVEDVKKIIRVTGITPRNVQFYAATGWKWKVYMKALQLAKLGELDIGTLIRESFKDDELKALRREVPNFARIVAEDVKKTPSETVRRRIEMGVINEVTLLEDAASIFKK